jgi:hypothetical protein
LASITTSGSPLTKHTTSGVRWCVPWADSTSISSVTSQRLAAGSAQSMTGMVGWCFLPSGMNSVTVMPSASLPYSRSLAGSSPSARLSADSSRTICSMPLLDSGYHWPLYS